MKGQHGIYHNLPLESILSHLNPLELNNIFSTWYLSMMFKKKLLLHAVLSAYEIVSHPQGRI
jgi:hypothetical protein